ncbi:MAG TPA: GGDEF domain-containing protein, partial [Burkholderiaceae bacterium]
MLPTQQVFLIAALLCLLSFLVLYSFRSNAVRGLNQVLLATVLGMVGNALYAFGRELPPVLAFEAANGVYAAATAALLVGYRNLFRQRSHVKLLCIAVATLVWLIAIFHYLVDSFFARSVIVSAFQVAMAAGVASTLLRARS